METTNTNSQNLDDCSSCASCYSCYSCYSCASCYYSKGLRMSGNMIFCLGEGYSETKGVGYQKNNMIFNKPVSEEELCKIKTSLPIIKLAVNKLSYQEAWAKWWSEAKTEDKEKILNIPQFDGKIFTAITGITDFKSKSLSGKTVVVKVDGVEYTATIN